MIIRMTHQNSTSATALHEIADVSWLNTGSNEWLYVVMVQFFELQTQSVIEETRACVKLHKTTRRNVTGTQTSKTSREHLKNFSYAPIHGVDGDDRSYGQTPLEPTPSQALDTDKFYTTAKLAQFCKSKT